MEKKNIAESRPVVLGKRQASKSPVFLVQQQSSSDEALSSYSGASKNQKNLKKKTRSQQVIVDNFQPVKHTEGVIIERPAPAKRGRKPGQKNKPKKTI